MTAHTDESDTREAGGGKKCGWMTGVTNQLRLIELNEWTGHFVRPVKEEDKCDVFRFIIEKHAYP